MKKLDYLNIAEQLPGTYITTNSGTRRKQLFINNIIDILATKQFIRELELPSLIPLDIIPERDLKFVYDTIDDENKILSFIHNPIVYTNLIATKLFSNYHDYKYYTVTKCYDKRYKERTLLVFETRNTLLPRREFLMHKLLKNQIFKAAFGVENKDYAITSTDSQTIYYEKADNRKIAWTAHDIDKSNLRTFIDIDALLKTALLW